MSHNNICSLFSGGHGTFSNLINNFVHVVMYFYYMVAAMGPEYQKYLWWKKHLTTLQLVSVQTILMSIYITFKYRKLIHSGYTFFNLKNLSFKNSMV